jgi:hypothetical protein
MGGAKRYPFCLINGDGFRKGSTHPTSCDAGGEGSGEGKMSNSDKDIFFSPHGKWLQSHYRFVKLSFSSILNAVLRSAVIVVCIGEVAMASNGLTIPDAKLRELRASTEIILMIVPYPTFFRSIVDRGRISDVSCVYEIRSGRGPTFDELLDVIGRAAIEYNEGKQSDTDLRVGLVFKKDDKTTQELYFDDGGENRKVSGFFNDDRIFASADLPNRLRSLLTHSDVAPVRSGNHACPHS